MAERSAGRRYLRGWRLPAQAHQPGGPGIAEGAARAHLGRPAKGEAEASEPPAARNRTVDTALTEGEMPMPPSSVTSLAKSSNKANCRLASACA